MNQDDQIVDFPRQGWRCLRDDVIAAYLDGSLDDFGLRRTQSHLASCQACRSLVADVVAMRRLETVQLPPGLKERAFSTALPSKNRRTMLFPAFAAAGTGCVVLAIFLAEAPQKLNLPVPKPSTAPVIAKADLPPTPSANSQNVVRKLTEPENTPTILLPAENTTVRRNQLRFSWKPVSRAQYYETHVVTPEGEPVWKGESKTNRLDLPTDLAVSDSAFFASVQAVTDGHIKKPAPFRFLVTQAP